MTIARIASLISAVMLVTSLAACGGGASGDSTGTPAPAAPTPTPAPAPAPVAVASSGTLRTGAPTSAYAPSSQQAGFFGTLNNLRAAAGAGYVDQNTTIDVASQAHADYLSLNLAAATAAGESPHSESASRANYYEASPASRLAKAGFSAGFSTEVIGGTGPSLAAADCVLGLMDTVYHAAALLSQETTIGVGVGSDAAGIPLCVSDLADVSADSYGQVPASGALIAYPFDGQTDVLGLFDVSSESPRPSVTLFPNAAAGTPVVVRLRNADFVNAQAAGTLAAKVTQFSLTDAGGNTIPAGILSATDVAGSGVTLNADSALGDGFVVLVPLSPLAANATYTAHFSATLTVGGTALTKSWSFTTGA